MATRSPDSPKLDGQAGVSRRRPRRACAYCGIPLGHLERRHSIDGAVFHVECVPSARWTEQGSRRAA